MRNLRNNRGSLYAIVLGLSMIIGGILIFLMLNVIFEGTHGDGIFHVAETDMGINNSTGSTLWQMKMTWKLTPWAFIIAGFLTIIFDLQRVEPFPSYEQGYYG